MDLTDASAIVTGGAGGFGSATVRRLAQKGAKVVIADVSERLWPLSNEGVANRHFEGIEELEEALVERCVALCDQPEFIRYHWWPEAA
jgi:NAD(P)-dependent dehydrogenase (short-subunit alcohol dehydrogenase family)